jgi:hypothetical protein
MILPNVRLFLSTVAFPVEFLGKKLINMPSLAKEAGTVNHRRVTAGHPGERGDESGKSRGITDGGKTLPRPRSLWFR